VASKVQLLYDNYQSDHTEVVQELQTADLSSAIETVDDDLVAALDRLVGAAVAVTTVALSQTVGGDELTLPQWRALVVITSASGLRASEVAARIGMSRPSMTRLVQRLVRRGVVVVTSDPSDGRATILRPTQAGLALRVATMSRRRKLIVDALGARTWSLPPELVRGLDAIAESLERYG
jgi:DNA-binding MarR family transcriptional regulator